MKSVPTITLIALLLLGGNLAPSFADQTYAEFTFDDKAIDEPIGTGGPAVGEPSVISENLEAIVRSAPFDTPSLEVHNTNPALNGGLWFELPGSVSSGLVVIIMDLWFYGSGPGWTPYCEIYTSGYQTLMSFWLESDGGIRIIGGGTDTVLPDFPTDRSFPILIALNMDADTYSVWMDAVQWVADEPLQQTDDSFRRIFCASGSDGDPLNRLSIDQIRVLDWLPPVATETTTWGRVRALFR